MGSLSTEYKFFPITPNTPELPSLALKHRDLRLSALQLSPQSFSSTYAAEAKISDDAWLARLTPKGKTLFAASTVTKDPKDEEWAAVVTMVGPFSATDYEFLPGSNFPPIKSDHIEQRWQVSSLYVLPTHRGQNLGTRLCRFAIDYLRAKTDVPELRVRLGIKTGNDVVEKMYQRMGFVRCGEGGLEDALRSNGETESLPEPASMEGDSEAAVALRQKYRGGGMLLMQLIVER
jgi:GNAT superfamily N-acetyltransferase